MTLRPTGQSRMALIRPVVVLLVGALGCGCSGPSFTDSPIDASTEEFCLTYAKQATEVEEEVRTSLNGPDQEMPSGDDLAEIWHNWAKEMSAVGTPTGISSDARSGFERALEEAAAMDPDDVDPESVEDFDPSESWDDLSSQEFKAVRALNTYVSDTCFPLYHERGLLP